jgi:hypothetical protein
LQIGFGKLSDYESNYYSFMPYRLLSSVIFTYFS